MDFQLSAEHQELRRMLRAFFEKEAPHELIMQLDREERYPAEIYAKMAALGLCGMTIPEEYGGNPADEIALCILSEEMSRASAALLGAFIPTVTFAAKGIADYGSEEQRRELLPKVAAGDLRFAMGLTEPDAGSDLTHLTTRADADGENFKVRGQKVFTTGAAAADYIFAFVRTGAREDSAAGALSVVLVPADAPGVSIRPLRKLAGQATHTCEVFFNDVIIPAANLVGQPGDGVRMIFSLLNRERILCAAQSIGIAQGAFDYAFRYAHERRQFGQPIVEFQAVGHMLADMATEIEAARLLTFQAAWKLEQGQPVSADSSMAKVFASEMASRCASKGMSVLGGYSYMQEYPMERYYRECKLNEIAGGTNQVLRTRIVRYLDSET
jgi:alkylation response protein AidB-like acyl-CoA dehydrogenase